MLEAFISGILATAAFLAWVAYRNQGRVLDFFRQAREEYVDECLMRLGVNRLAHNAVTAALAVAGACLGLVVLKNPPAVVLLAVFAVMYRRRSLYLQRQERKALIDQQAEVALQMVASLYETMGDMVRALEGTSKCVPHPMSAELRRVVAEYRAGKPMAEALRDFAERSENRDIDVFVKGVLLSEKYGTNTAEVVHDVAGLVRDRITLRDELKNELRGQKLTVNIFLLLIPVVGAALFLFSPEARNTMVNSLAGKGIVCALACVEYFAWHFTRGQGVVEDL